MFKTRAVISRRHAVWLASTRTTLTPLCAECGGRPPFTTSLLSHGRSRAAAGAAGWGCRLGPHRLTHSVVTRSTPGATPNPSTGPLPWDAASSRTVHTSSQGQGLAACGLHCPPCWLRKMLLALNISKPKKKKNPCLTSTSSQLYHVLGQTSSILLSAYFTWHRVI